MHRPYSQSRRPRDAAATIGRIKYYVSYFCLNIGS